MRSGYGRPRYIMMMNWRGKNSKESEKGKKIAAKYMKKAVLCFVSFCRLLVAQAALLHSGPLPQTEQQSRLRL